MDNPIDQAGSDLREAIATVDGVRLHTDTGELAPPAAVVGPPALEWQAMCSAPTSARYMVWLVVSISDRATSQLLELLPKVAEAIDALTDATVVRADPGVYPASAGDLPAYQIQVDVSL